jgi:hypothetical protein
MFKLYKFLLNYQSKDGFAMAKKKRKVVPNSRKKTKEAVMRIVRQPGRPTAAVPDVVESSHVQEQFQENNVVMLAPAAAPRTGYYSTPVATTAGYVFSMPSSTGTVKAKMNHDEEDDADMADAAEDDLEQDAPEQADDQQQNDMGIDHVTGQMVGSSTGPDAQPDNAPKPEAGELVGLYNYLMQTTQGAIPPHLAARMAVLARLHPGIFQGLLQKQLDDESYQQMVNFALAQDRAEKTTGKTFDVSVVTADGASHALETDSLENIKSSLYGMDGAHVSATDHVIRYAFADSRDDTYTEFDPKNQSYSMHTKPGAKGHDMKDQAVLILEQLKASGNKTASFNGPCKPEFILAMLSASRVVDGITLDRTSLEHAGLNPEQLKYAQASLDQINAGKITQVKSDTTADVKKSEVGGIKATDNKDDIKNSETKSTEEYVEYKQKKKNSWKNVKKNVYKIAQLTAFAGLAVWGYTSLSDFIEERKNPKPKTGYKINVDENTADSDWDNDDNYYEGNGRAVYPGFEQAFDDHVTRTDLHEMKRELQTEMYINQKGTPVESVSDQLKREAKQSAGYNPFPADSVDVNRQHKEAMKKTQNDQKAASTPVATKPQPQNNNTTTPKVQTPVTGQTGLNALKPEEPGNVQTIGDWQNEMRKIGIRQNNLNYEQGVINRDKAELNGQVKDAINVEDNIAKAAKFRKKKLKRIMRKNANEVSDDLYNNGQGPDLGQGQKKSRAFIPGKN